MSHKTTIHPVQVVVLRELLFAPSISFSDLQRKTGLSSDHFKFHLQQLVENNYVIKNSVGLYQLNQPGKEYANKLDTDKNVIERQPKSSVIIMLKNNNKVLVQERLKHPYYGFYGYPGGKIRWGESIIEAGIRELKEETNLESGLIYRGVYHEHVQSAETNEIIEDKIFHVLYGSSFVGKLKDSFEGGRNVWLSLKELGNIKTKYLSCDIETKIGLGEETFIEKTQTYTKDQF